MALTQAARVACLCVLTLAVCSPLVFAENADPTSPADAGATELPDFMEKWEFGLDIKEDAGPKFFIDPIAPIYRAPDDAHVVFIEPRLTYRDAEWLLNLGTGYRHLTEDKRWVFGGNLFYDYETEVAHSRVGLGLEALSSHIEWRSNVYVPTSGERTVEENGGGTLRERAIPGFDTELGAPVPFYSRLKFYGGYYWYALPDFKNRYGWQMRAEYTPVPFLVIDGLVSNDTKTNVDWGIKVGFRIPWGRNIEAVRSPFRLDPAMFPPSDASQQVFALVERHHEIVVQRSQTTPAGLTIEAGRSN